VRVDSRSVEITPTIAILERFGVRRKGKYSALEHLRGAGLIAVHQKPRRNPVVTILDIKAHTPAGPHGQDSTGMASEESENQQADHNHRKDMVNPCE
jgi:hypothetical protein